MGRTPLTREFVHYGDYEIHLRKEGYYTLKTNARVRTPVWQWVPFDLVTELLPIPLRDRKRFAYVLEPMPPGAVDSAEILGRAEELRAEMQQPRRRPPDP